MDEACGETLCEANLHSSYEFLLFRFGVKGFGIPGVAISEQRTVVHGMVHGGRQVAGPATENKTEDGTEGVENHAGSKLPAKHMAYAWLVSAWDRAVSFILQQTMCSLSTGPLPRHIAFIMDGNRRWSRAHNMRVQEGHLKGFEALKRVLDLCLSLQRIEVVTVYAFAIDNFKRDPDEVHALMELARTRLLELYEHSDFVARHSICIRVVGHREYLPPSVQETARRVEEATQHNTGYVVYASLYMRLTPDPLSISACHMHHRPKSVMPHSKPLKIHSSSHQHHSRRT